MTMALPAPEWACKKIRKLEDEIDKLKEAARASSGGCRLVSESGLCNCGLCIRDNEIKQLKTQLRQQRKPHPSLRLP